MVLVEKTTLPELAAIIRQASLTIANKSVSVQLADVFGCSMVILHSKADIANQWMPRNVCARLLSRPAPCSRCNQPACPQGINCLDVRPEKVAIAGLQLLTRQTHIQSGYKGIFETKRESERRDNHVSAR